jgi:glycosyltransferase involved in cell wall biosynthesis
MESLRAQTLPLDQWELLLVDNASGERLADRWDLRWHPGARHVREEELGLTPARLRGIKEARGGLLVFVDDDNVLGPGYLTEAAAIARHYPQLAVFGAGVLEPEFEIQPAPELAPLLPLLALRKVSSVLWSNNPKDTECFPWGAGLCVSRAVAGQYCELAGRLNSSKVFGRRGQQLFCGEDDLFSWTAVAAGQGFGLFPALKITHLISEGRLSRSYFLRLLGDHAFSHVVLRRLLFGANAPRNGPYQVARILWHGMRHGLFSMQCRWARLRGENRAARYIADHRLSGPDPLFAKGQVYV